ncbi:hypothetical protein CLV51_10374 [Chitinophaga niastensis]|uniref:TonB-dependent receptor-like protein n=1 Tax=Chitinophaga niastensis TaxID=536980 RepID=A0A2P8HIQ5_CHINA|nr:hypothetical protein [Chitinophaga niastensis]PSL46098.1 hypothetical protein CLV51_10374 [Chitinophaga niastensis]
MKARILLISALFFSFGATAQSVENDDPVYVLDSVVVTQSIIGQVTPDKIGLITIATGKGTKTLLKYGSQAANGVVYVETKPFARKRVNTLLSLMSPAYDSLLHKYGNDSSFYFIVNNKPITTNNEMGLMTVDTKTFISVKILSEQELQDKYQVMDRKVGILISSREE